MDTNCTIKDVGDVDSLRSEYLWCTCIMFFLGTTETNFPDRCEIPCGVSHLTINLELFQALPINFEYCVQL